MLSIMGGVYTIRYKSGATKTRQRGFDKKIDFFELVEKYSNQDNIPLEITRVVSLGDVVLKTKLYSLGDLNLFKKELKVINLNADNKRMWKEHHKGKDLLKHVYDSMAKIQLENPQMYKAHKKSLTYRKFYEMLDLW